MERRYTEKEIVKSFIMNGYNERTIIELRKMLHEVPIDTSAWVPNTTKKGKFNYMCSKCKGSRGFKFKYCPDCGTEMVNPQIEKNKRNRVFD